MTSIESLPEEVFYIIAQFLSGTDLDACFNVNLRWKYIFNTDNIWKRCCYYPEKYFKNNSGLSLQLPVRKNHGQIELCTWRQYFELQQHVWNNWSKGQFEIEKTVISQVSYLHDVVDDLGNHWLFDVSVVRGVTIWNANELPYIHSKINETDHFDTCLMKDKVLMVRSNYVKVFHFRYPEYEMKLHYRFKFNMADILPSDEYVPDYDYMSGVRYIIVDNSFIGYSENVTNIHMALFHIWDIDSASKIAVNSAFQQSFVDFIFSSTGNNAIENFIGGLLLFSGNTRQFLVTLIDDRFKLCQVSLFCLDRMRFTKVITQLSSRTAWCFMKGNTIVIYHTDNEKTSLLSVYSVDGLFLTKLIFPAHYNPAFTNEFWFSESNIILKVGKMVHVVTLFDSRKINESNFSIEKENYILSFYNPKFLLLYNKPSINSELSFETVTVWDIELGQKLWNLGKLYINTSFIDPLRNTEFPNKLLVLLEGNKEMSILHFAKFSNYEKSSL